MKDEIVSAALRIRLNSLHEGHGLKESIECPGCRKSLHPREANQHLSGCARIKGRSAAGRHAYLKNATGRICTANGIHHQHKEPQGYEMRVCTICRSTFPESKSASHIETCQGSSIHHIKEAASVRPDKWIELRPEKGNGLIEVVIDVSIVAGTTATNINGQLSIADGLRERERRKKVLYAEAAEERGEKLIVVAVTPNGTLSSGTKEFARMIARTSDSKGAYTANHAERDIRRAVMIGSATSLINAERAAKIYFSPKATRDVEQIMEAYNESAAEDAPEWYELPEDAMPPSVNVEMKEDVFVPSRGSQGDRFRDEGSRRVPTPSKELIFVSCQNPPHDLYLEMNTAPPPVLISTDPVHTQNPNPTRSGLSRPLPPPSSSLLDVSLSLSSGASRNSASLDSQKTQPWSMNPDAVVLGPQRQEKKK